MYEFNYWLLEHLDEVTGIKRAGIGLRAGKSKDFMRHVLLESHDIKMCDLLDICNALRIPIGSFFFIEGKEPVRNLTPSFDCKPAKLDVTIYEELMKGSEGRYRVAIYKIMYSIGIEDCHARSWTKNMERITARTLVRLCNAMCLDMTALIACPMKSVPSLYTVKQFETKCAELVETYVQYDGKYAERLAANAAKKREKRQSLAPDATAEKLANIQQMLMEMQRTQQDMQRQIEALRSENRRLVEENTRLSIVASPKVGYEKSGE